MELKKQEIKIAQKTVNNYMREMSLRAHYIKSYIKTTIDSDFDSKLENLIKEQFNLKNQMPLGVQILSIYIPKKDLVISQTL